MSRRVFIGPVNGTIVGYTESGVPISMTEESIGPMQEITGVQDVHLTWSENDVEITN